MKSSQGDAGAELPTKAKGGYEDLPVKPRGHDGEESEEAKKQDGDKVKPEEGSSEDLRQEENAQSDGEKTDGPSSGGEGDSEASAEPKNNDGTQSILDWVQYR